MLCYIDSKKYTFKFLQYSHFQFFAEMFSFCAWVTSVWSSFFYLYNTVLGISVLAFNASSTQGDWKTIIGCLSDCDVTSICTYIHNTSDSAQHQQQVVGCVCMCVAWCLNTQKTSARSVSHSVIYIWNVFNRFNLIRLHGRSVTQSFIWNLFNPFNLIKSTQ